MSNSSKTSYSGLYAMGISNPTRRAVALTRSWDVRSKVGLYLSSRRCGQWSVISRAWHAYDRSWLDLVLVLGPDEQDGVLIVLLGRGVLVIYLFSNATEVRDDARVDFPGRRDLAGGQRVFMDRVWVAYGSAQFPQEPAVEGGSV